MDAHEPEVDYLVVVRVDGKGEFFGFPTAEARELFIGDIVERFPDIEYATTEAPRAVRIDVEHA